jgi:hypothetical protein
MGTGGEMAVVDQQPPGRRTWRCRSVRDHDERAHTLHEHHLDLEFGSRVEMARGLVQDHDPAR